MVEALIKSKIVRPQIGSRLVARPHLTAFLERERPGGVTLITAPLGYGKTTLVASWLQESGGLTAWISLHEEDNDPFCFCAHMLAAIRNAIPGFGHAIETLMRPPAPPLEAAMAEIVNDVAPRRRKLTLVLDDYHVITNDAIHQAIAFLVERQPINLHLVVISRTDPPSILSRPHSPTRLLRLSGEDLRFNAEETEKFLSYTMGMTLPRPKIDALAKQTQGWIAGLQLAALSLLHHSNNDSAVTGFSGYNDDITPFVIREVLSHLSEDTLSFLLQTSILDRLSAPLCNAVTGRADSDERLDELENRHLFLASLDHDRLWFRYHHLLADALRSQLATRIPEEDLRQLHARAASWFSDHRQVTEALHHAKCAQDTDLIANVLDLYGFDLLGEGQVAVLGTWLREVPQKVAFNYPHLCWLYAFLFYLGDGPDPDAAEPYLSAAERYLAEHGDELSDEEARIVRGKVVFMRGYQARNAGRITEAIELLGATMRNLSTEHLLYQTALWNQGMCRIVTNKFEAARAALAPLAAIDEDTTNYWVSVTALVGLARIRLAKGKPSAAAEICRRGLDQFRARGLEDLPVCGALLMQLGEVAYIQNRLEESEHLLERAVALSNRGGLQFFRGCSYVMLAQTRAALGLTEQLLWSPEFELRFLRAWGPIRITFPSFGAYLARFWLTQGRHEKVADWLEMRGIRYGDDPTPEREPEYIVLARLLCVQQRLGEAINLLELLLVPAKEEQRYGSAIEIYILLALAHEHQGDTKAATSALHHALRLGAQGQYVRVFLDEGDPMRVLLKRAFLQGDHPDFVRHLLDAGTPSDSRPQLGFAAPLSRKEEQVASYLITGLSNDEIANRMFLSLNTVKMHLKNLYRKLGVAKRYDAIQKIREIRSSE